MTAKSVTRLILRLLPALAAAALLVIPQHAALIAQATEYPASIPAPIGEPAPVDNAVQEISTGMASYYGSELAGSRTASGERFDPRGFTAAHRTLPFGSRVQVTSMRTGKSVVVRINDRGPFHGGRVIDLSKAAAREIGLAALGRGQVRISLLSE